MVENGSCLDLSGLPVLGKVVKNSGGLVEVDTYIPGSRPVLGTPCIGWTGAETVIRQFRVKPIETFYIRTA